MVAVSSQSYDGTHQVAVTPQTDAGVSLVSATSGVVTASNCGVGAAVESGQAVVFVNGAPVIGLATAHPLWRDLASGVKGSDVSDLQTELARLGYSVEVNGTYGTATRTAVAALFAAVGGSSKGDLSLGSIVWLSAPAVVVSACSVPVGATVTGGTELAQVGGGLRSLTVPNPPGDGWVATYGDATAAMDANGVITDTAFLTAVAAGPDYAVLMSGQGQGSLQVTVRLASPLTVLAVPPSSVVVAGAGKGCVVTAGGMVPVVIVSSSLGQTMVAVDGTPPSEVVVQPDPSARCS